MRDSILHGVAVVLLILLLAAAIVWMLRGVVILW